MRTNTNTPQHDIDDDIIDSIQDAETSLSHLFELTRHPGAVGQEALFQIGTIRKPTEAEQLEVASHGSITACARLARYTPHLSVLESVAGRDPIDYYIAKALAGNAATPHALLFKALGTRSLRDKRTRHALNVALAERSLSVSDFISCALSPDEETGRGVHLFPWLPEEFIHSALKNAATPDWAKIMMLRSPGTPVTRHRLAKLARQATGEFADVVAEHLLTPEHIGQFTRQDLESIFRSEDAGIRLKVIAALGDPQTLHTVAVVSQRVPRLKAQTYSFILRHGALLPETLHHIWTSCSSKGAFAPLIRKHPSTDDLLRAKVRRYEAQVQANQQLVAA